MSHEIWVIDDDRSIRWVLEKALSAAGLSVRCFEAAEPALHELAQREPDALVTDIRMPGIDGLALLQRLRARHPELPAIVMTAHSDLDSAVAAYEGGAFEYLPKPFDIDDAVELVQRALRHRREGTAETGGDLSAPAKLADIIGEAPAMQEVFRAIGRLTRSHVTVLINGESGTGKELVAQALHRHSPRANKPFIAINTAAIPRDLLEAELFGHERGAFTGATGQRRGRFEQANGGTLFLDEIGDMPADLQTRLLRVLADGEFYRIGGHTPVKVDVRIIAATHQDMEAQVRSGRFREDLFHRLNVIRIHIPPLRARSEDIPALLRFFLERAAKELGGEPKRVSAEVATHLAQLPWPGNVRQLENACRWLTVMAASRDVQLDDLPPELRQLSAADPAPAPPTGPSAEQISGVGPGFSSGVNPGVNSGVGPRVDQANGESPMRPLSTESVADQAALQRHPQAHSDGAVAAKPVPAAAVAVAPPAPGALQPLGDDWAAALRQWAKTQLEQGQEKLLDQALPEFEKQLIEVALAHTGGRRQEAAALLGWGRNTLTRKINELQL